MRLLFTTKECCGLTEPLAQRAHWVSTLQDRKCSTGTTVQTFKVKALLQENPCGKTMAEGCSLPLTPIV